MGDAEFSTIARAHALLRRAAQQTRGMTTTADDAGGMPRTGAAPLRSDEEILQHAERLIGRAARRQCWLMPLDADDRTIPVLLPITGLPRVPTAEEVEGFRERLGGFVEALEAARLILVFERPGPAALAEGEQRWLRGLYEEGEQPRLAPPVRALLLSHDDGVRLLGPEDLA